MDSDNDAWQGELEETISRSDYPAGLGCADDMKAYRLCTKTLSQDLPLIEIGSCAQDTWCQDIISTNQSRPLTIPQSTRMHLPNQSALDLKRVIVNLLSLHDEDCEA